RPRGARPSRLAEMHDHRRSGRRSRTSGCRRQASLCRPAATSRCRRPAASQDDNLQSPPPFTAASRDTQGTIMTAASPLMSTYPPQPVAFERGEGVRLYDTQGRRYLDCLSGIAVNTLGHAHPRLVAALGDQIGKIIHTSNLFEIPLQRQVATHLVRLSGMTNVFFCNSGLEANEAAIKIARLYGHDRGVKEP